MKRFIGQAYRMTWLLALAGFLSSTAMTHAAAPAPIKPQPSDQQTGALANPVLKWNYGQANLLINGDFESGDFTGWDQDVDGFGGIEIDDGTLNPFGPEGEVPPFAGAFSATYQAAPFGDATYVLFQIVNIPTTTDTAVLRWSDLMNNFSGTFNNGPPFQRFSVQIRDETGNRILGTVYSTNPGELPFTPWSKRVADLSEFRGQTVTIGFLLQTQIDWFNLHLDNVRLDISIQSGITNDVLLGTSPSLGATNLVATTVDNRFETTGLTPDTTYYWRVITKTASGSAGGPIWEFTTGSAGPVDHFVWEPIASPQSPGQPISVRITAKDAFNFTVTDFNGTVDLSAQAPGAGSELNLLPDVPFTAFTSFQQSTMGYSFTPTTDLWLTGVRAFTGDKISVWTDSGIPVASQSFPLVEATWTDTAFDDPVMLQANRTYRVGAFANALVSQYTRFDMTPAFAHGTIDQSYQTSGDGFPSIPHASQWWFVDLIYSADTSAPIGVSPVQSGAFVNGVWTGQVTLNSGAPQVVLKASAGSGAAGFSPAFSMDNALTILEIRQENSDIVIVFMAEAGQTYSVLYSDSLSAPNWLPLSHVDTGATRPVEVRDPNPASQQRYYQLVTPQQQ